MIRKSAEEKALLKAAKTSYKKKNKEPDYDEILFHPKEIIKKKPDLEIKTGIFDGELPLKDDYPVYAGYYYVIDDGEVVNSNFSGSVKMFRNQLRNSGHDATVIRNCILHKRNLI